MDIGITNLFECGRKLNLKNQIISSAAIYYHKFFRILNEQLNESNESNPIESIDENLIACTCIQLASKFEENPIKLKDLLCAFNDCVNKTNELNYDKFNQLTNSIVLCEMLICQTINFNLNNELPHKYLLYYLKSLNEWLFNDQNQSVQFSNLCWSLLIDFFRSSDCIIQDNQTSLLTTYKPQEISISIIQIAIRVFKDKLEKDNQKLDQLIDYTNQLYDHLDKDNLWKINLIIMKTFKV